MREGDNYFLQNVILTVTEKAVTSAIIENTVNPVDLCVIEAIDVRIPVRCSCES